MKKKTYILPSLLFMGLLAKANYIEPFLKESFNSGFPASWSTGEAASKNLVCQYGTNVQSVPG